MAEKITTSSHGDESYSGRKDQKPEENGVVKGGGNQQNGRLKEFNFITNLVFLSFFYFYFYF